MMNTTMMNSADNTKKEQKLYGLTSLGAYLIVWMVAVAAFWLFAAKSADALGYALVYFWIILPGVTFIVSLILGIKQVWGMKRWFLSIGFGLMYMLAEYLTFLLANNLATGGINQPSYGLIIVGMVISLVGLGIGEAVFQLSKEKKKR